MKKISTLLLLMVACLTASAQYQASPEILKARTEFQDNKFGIYIHWGLYSMLGNGEWVMSNRNINYKEYTHLADGFYPSKFDAEEWVKAFKAAGVRDCTLKLYPGLRHEILNEKPQRDQITNDIETWLLSKLP